MQSLKRIVCSITIVSLVLLGIPFHPNPTAADTLDKAKVTISDSKPSVSGVTYQFEFTTNATATSITFTFDDSFTSNSGALPTASSDYTCPTGLSLTATTTGSYTCSGGSLSPGAASSIVNNVTNPNKVAPPGTADIYTVKIETSASEIARVKFAIIEGVVVTATVDSILSFSVAGTSTGVGVKNVSSNVTTTAVSIPFGTLPLDSSRIGVQELTVATNASDGFTVVVFQDHDLTSAAGDKIHCFDDGSCVNYSSAKAWEDPSGILDQINTYGHFGFTSEDESVQTDGTCSTSTVGAYGNYNADRWAGFNGTTQVPVMCHVGPSDGATYQVGKIKVGYRVQITALQAAGEYSNTLTYIATPTY